MSFRIGLNDPPQKAQLSQTQTGDDEVIRVQTCIRKDIPVSQQPTSSCELMPLGKGEAGGATKRSDAAMYGAGKRSELERRIEQGGFIVGNTAKGIEADRLLPQRYRLEPQRGDVVTGIRDTQAGKVRGNPPRPVGAAVIRLDIADKKTRYPHININPNLTGVDDPHIRISPTTLKVAGGAARTLEAFGKVARPVAIVTDTIRLGAAIHADGNTIGKNTAVTAGSVAGGWAGAAAGGFAGAKGGAVAGAFVGAFFGGIGAVPGAAIGGFVGGLGGSIAGAFVGSAAGEAAAEAAVGKP